MKRGRKHSATKWAAVKDQSPSIQIESAVWGEIPTDTRCVIDFLRYCSNWRQNPPTGETDRICKINTEKWLLSWLINAYDRRDTKALSDLTKAVTALKSSSAVDALGLALIELKSLTDGTAWVSEKETGISRPIDVPLSEWPPESIMAQLNAKGVQSDWTTVRRRMKELGIVRKGGRPKKPRNS